MTQKIIIKQHARQIEYSRVLALSKHAKQHKKRLIY
jgi:hypothetical protein